MKLFYRKSGTGRPLIILHGLFGISDNWAALAKRWSEHFTVYAVDLRNHGQSGHSDEWNYNVMAEDILELIANERLRDITILGHSMGGKAAMQLVSNYPNSVSKLIVCDISPKQYPVHNEKVIEALLDVKPEQCTTRKDAEIILSRHLSDQGTIQFLLKNLYWKETGNEVKKLAWRFNLKVISERINEVYTSTLPDPACTIPSLFLRGERSDYVKGEDENIIKRYFLNADIVTVTNAGHWIHADNPEEVFTAVMNFAC